MTTPTRLFSRILSLAIQGKLVSNHADDTVDDLLKEIAANNSARKKSKSDPIPDDQIPFAIPDNWKWVRLGEVCEKLYAGGDAPKDNFSKERTEKYLYPIYANAVANGGLYGYTDSYVEDKKCITIAARGSGTGFTMIREEPFTPIVRLIVICPDEAKVDIHFLKYYLNYNGFIKSGTNIPQLTIPMVENAKIVIPSLNEQKIISSKIIELENKILELENTLLDLNKQKAIILGEIVQIGK